MECKVQIKQGSDSDFPIFRLADAYLMYANVSLEELAVMGTALGYVNAVRTRANGAYKCRRFNYGFHIRRES
jgi:hypothetical protein